MKEVVMSLQKQLPVEPFLKTVFRATIERAHWLALGLLVTVGIFSFWNTHTLIETNNSQILLRLLLNELQGAISTVDDAERGQRGYLLIGDESYLEPYQKAVKVVDRQFDRVEKLMGQQSTFDALRRLVTMKFTELKQLIKLQQSEGIEAATRVVRTGRGKEIMNEIRALTDQINDDIQERLATYDRQIVTLSTRATLWSILVNALAAILFVSVIEREYQERMRVESRAQERSLSAETSRIRTLRQSDGKIEAMGKKAGELARSVESLRKQSIVHLEGETESLGQPPRDLANEIEALAVQAQDLVRSAEKSQRVNLDQSNDKLEAMGQVAQELAISVETSRIQTLNQSDEKIEALGKQARELARSVETSRVQTLNQSDKEIEALGKQAREVARSVETSRIQTLNQSDKEIETLEQQARELATIVESSRMQTLNRSDEKIEALEQRARELATTVETARIQTLNQSNKTIRKLNEELK
jgi:CHASE3 domain sensor protein/archaellum component FlaC